MFKFQWRIRGTEAKKYFQSRVTSVTAGAQT
jgi:hypothetical protein